MSKPCKPEWKEVLLTNKNKKQNSFVDTKRLMEQALEEQPKYFKEGSLMNNLIESGIEVVWFSGKAPLFWKSFFLLASILFYRSEPK